MVSVGKKNCLNLWAIVVGFRQANVDPPTLSWRLIDERFLDAVRQLESNGEPVKSKDVLSIMNVPGLRRSQVQTRIQRWRRETGQGAGAVRSARSDRRSSRSTADVDQTAVASTSSSGEHGATVLPPVLAPSQPPSALALSASRKRSAPDDERERMLVQSTTTLMERRRQSASTTTIATISSTAIPLNLSPSPSQRCGLWSEIDELPIEAAAHARLFEREPHDLFNSDLGHSTDRHQ